MKIYSAASPTFSVRDCKVDVFAYMEKVCEMANQALRQLHPDTSISYTKLEHTRDYNPDNDMGCIVVVRVQQ